MLLLFWREDLFSHVDVHGESSVTWEDVSNYFIEQGMSGGDEFTVDSIKTYEVSQVKDDVQLCLQWDSLSRSLFSGAIDGTLSRWDARQWWDTTVMKPKKTFKGHKKAEAPKGSEGAGPERPLAFDVAGFEATG
eukprot:Skav232327  [mRNA]  locus=scaffold2697:354817:358597:- [translate_table: standard]